MSQRNMATDRAILYGDYAAVATIVSVDCERCPLWAPSEYE